MHRSEVGNEVFPTPEEPKPNKTDFTLALPYIQATLNNAPNPSTGYAPNELAYGFCTNDSLSRLTDLPPQDFTQLRQVYREEAEEAIALAQAFLCQKHQSNGAKPSRNCKF